MTQRYRLKLSKLQFCSLVDDPAQPNAKTLLIKRASGDEEIVATARLAKVNDELGLAFFWAFTSTNPDGTDHFDLHNDTVDADFIKAAMEWALEGGAVDEMHDGVASGARTVFAMPMDPEIAKIYGLTTKQSGLMIAIKPTPDQLAKLKDGTYTGVSIGGLGVREAIKSAPARVAKHSLYTDAQLGHQHKVCVYDDGSLYVEWATMEGADQGHSHGIVWENGALTILADSGHVHQLADGQPGVVVVPADAIVVIQASASKSTRSAAIEQPALTKEDQSMSTPADPKQLHDVTKQLDTANKRVDELTAKLELQTKLASLSDAQRGYYKSLGAADAEEFLGKSYADRELDVAVEYTAKDGTVYRKHDDRRLIDMAKRHDKMTEDLAKRDDEIEKAEIAVLAKSTLGSVAGKDEVHQYIVRSIRKGGGNAAMVEEALTALRGANAAAKSAGYAKGYNPGAEPVANSHEATLESIAQKIATEQKVDIAKARDMALDTPEGVAAYAAMKARPAMNKATA